jgi:iron complex transport system substrate-binding protein
MLSGRMLPWCFGVLCVLECALSLAPPSVSTSAAPGSTASTTVVSDANDRAVSVRLPAQRVVIFPPLLSGYATLDGGVGHVVAASSFMADQLSKAPIGHVYPALRGIPPVATVPRGTTFPSDPEQVLLMQPDAVLIWRRTGDTLERSGLPVLEITSLFPGKEAQRVWAMMAQLTMQEDRGDRLLQRYRETDRRILDEVNNMPQRPKPRILMMWHNDPLVFYVARSSFPPASDIERLGAINLATVNKIGRIDVEGLLALDADIIFLNAIASITEEPHTFYDQPIFQSMKSVRNRRIYKLPLTGNRMEGISPDHDLYLEWIAEVLYPDRIPVRLRDMFKSIYQDVYHYSISDVEIDDALFVRENSASAAAERFARSAATLTAPSAGDREKEHL